MQQFVPYAALAAEVATRGLAAELAGGSNELAQQPAWQLLAVVWACAAVNAEAEVAPGLTAYNGGGVFMVQDAPDLPGLNPYFVASALHGGGSALYFYEGLTGRLVATVDYSYNEVALPPELAALLAASWWEPLSSTVSIEAGAYSPA